MHVRGVGSATVTLCGVLYPHCPSASLDLYGALIGPFNTNVLKGDKEFRFLRAGGTV